MIDSHCHLDDIKFVGDLAEVLACAKAAGVNAIINPGAAAETLAAPFQIALNHADVYAAVGAHPLEIAGLDDNYFQRLAELLKQPKIVAVGEVGLENAAASMDIAKQLIALKSFVDLAVAAGKPVIFHIRDTQREFQDFLQSYKIEFPGVLHCFSGTTEDADFYLRRGFYISVAGIVTFPKADALRAVVKEIPLEKILLETDSPYLAPQTVRGQRNEPSCVVEIAKKVAEIKGISVEEVDRVTEVNTRKLFGI